MTLTKKLAVLAAGGALVVGTAACNSNSPTPASNTGGNSNSSTTPAANGDAKGLYQAAAAKMYDATDSTVTIKFDTTADEIKKLGTVGTKPTTISDPIANFIAGSTITYKAHGTAPLKNLSTDPTQMIDNDLGMTFTSGSGQKVELLVLDQWGSVYAKAPVLEMYKTFTGQDLSSQLAMMPDWVRDFANDKRIGLQLPASVRDQMKKSMASAKPTAATNEVDMVKLIEDNATFTDKGDKDGGKAIQMSLKLKPVMNKLSQSGSATMATDYAKSEQYFKDDATAVVDMVIKDDHIASGRFDLAQVKDWIDSSKMSEKDLADFNKFVALDFKAALEMTMDSTADLTKPSDARMVTQQELQQLGTLFSGGR